MIPSIIKRKIRQRNRLLSKLKHSPMDSLKSRVKNLNKEIKDHFIMNKRKRVRKGIIPGNNKSLWKAVNVAKDLNHDQMPLRMCLNGVEISDHELPDCFADYFEAKINDLVSKTRIDQNILDWLNLSLISYKLKMKEVFLSND